MCKKVFILVLLATSCLLTSCASQPQATTDPETGKTMVNRDPYEGFNRFMFRFNDMFDKGILSPVTNVYTAITPDPVERGVSNFFSNLLEVRNVVNDMLQFKFKQAGIDTGRFLINTTIGLLGIFDVAKHMGLEKQEGEDFGQTLGHWGVDSGPYIVLPFIGPSSLRDAPSFFVDAQFNPARHIDHVPTRNQVLATGVIDTRAQLQKTEDIIEGDRYIFIRDAFLQRRHYLVNDGEVEDIFVEDGDTGEGFDF